MRVGTVIPFAAAALLVAAGPQALGRLALLGGMPSLAARMLVGPEERGIALYQSGDYAKADAAFESSRKNQTYNRALSLAAVGDYPLSVAYFDAVLYDNPSDAEARRNRELVAALDPDVTMETTVPGRIVGVAGSGNEAEQATAIVTAGVQDPEWQRKVTARGIVATDTWLETLSDDPGEFLKLRLRAEFDRRGMMGVLNPPGVEPW